MISKVKPLHDKVVSTTSAVDNAEHKMATLESKRKALEVRLKDLAKGFEDATIDKNDQEEKTIKMDRMLSTAGNLRQVCTCIWDWYVCLYETGMYMYMRLVCICIWDWYVCAYETGKICKTKKNDHDHVVLLLPGNLIFH